MSYFLAFSRDVYTFFSPKSLKRGNSCISLTEILYYFKVKISPEGQGGYVLRHTIALTLPGAPHQERRPRKRRSASSSIRPPFVVNKSRSKSVRPVGCGGNSEERAEPAVESPAVAAILTISSDDLRCIRCVYYDTTTRQ